MEHNIKTYKLIQFEDDDEFIYKSDMSYVNGMGYECDPGGSKDACANGDMVEVSFGRFKRKRVQGVFRCVRDVTGDKWVPVNN